MAEARQRVGFRAGGSDPFGKLNLIFRRFWSSFR